MSSLLTPQSTGRPASATNLFLFESERLSDGTTVIDVSAVSPTAPVEPDRLADTIARFLAAEEDAACGRIERSDAKDQSLEQPYGKIGPDHRLGKAQEQPAPVGFSAAQGDVETIRVTGAHPFWSLDRQGWVRVEDLQAGERLQGIAGPVRVVSRTLRAEAEPVYNIEVDGDHCYRVGRQGLLVHNASFTITDDRANLHEAWDWKTKQILDKRAYDEYVPKAIVARQNSSSKQAGRKGSNLALIKTDSGGAATYAPIFNDKGGLHSEQIISNMYKGKFGPGTSVNIVGLFTERSPCQETVCGAVIVDLYRDNCAAFPVYFVVPAGPDSDLKLQAFYKTTNPKLDLK